MLCLLFLLFLVALALFLVCVFGFYVFQKITCGYVKNSVCLVGKTAIVTGGASGIGYEVVSILLSRGCKVIIADIEISETLKEELIEKTGNSNVYVKVLNLASIKSIKKFANDIIKEVDRLDILIHNAGLGAAKNVISEDGINTVFQVNCYGPLLLSYLLLDLLKKSSPSRIIFTSALMAFTSYLTLDKINPIFEKYDIFNACFDYSNSNLAVVIIANELANKLNGTGVTSNSLHPGSANTALKPKTLEIINIKILSYMWNIYAKFFCKNAWEAAQTTVHLATDKNLQTTSGKHFWDCREFIMPPFAYDKEFSRNFFERAKNLMNIKEE